MEVLKYSAFITIHQSFPKQPVCLQEYFGAILSVSSLKRCIIEFSAPSGFGENIDRHHCLIKGANVAEEDAGSVISYADGGVADVDSVVRVRGLNVELQDVVDVGRLNVQRAQTLHHPRLTAQHLEHTARKSEGGHL